MMLILCSDIPKENVEYLIKHTNKNFVFKSLLELLQLVCSAGISDVFRPLQQGIKLREWILEHKSWTYWYCMFLYDYCIYNLNLKFATIYKIKTIIRDLHNSTNVFIVEMPSHAIFRYKQGYKSKYETNSELPIYECCKEYKKYIDWKFKKSEVDYANI